jgi:hypothetical protein
MSFNITGEWRGTGAQSEVAQVVNDFNAVFGTGLVRTRTTTLFLRRHSQEITGVLWGN